MPIYKAGSLSQQEVQKLFLKGEKIIFESFSLPHDEEMSITNMLDYLLQLLENRSISDFLQYCLRELLTNAKKANTKRVYFENLDLDLHNHNDYKKGMKNFAKDTFNNIDYYLNLQQEKGLYIRAGFWLEDDIFVISISNNSPILPEELKVANEKIKRARGFKSFEEASSLIFNNPEGAGLGFIIIILMLKKLGIANRMFSLNIEDNDTVVTIRVPISIITEEQSYEINSLLVKEIDKIPQFPESVIQLEKMLDNKDTKIKEIAFNISIDPTLAAGVLKFVNSAQYMLPKKVKSILEAVKYIGIKGLKNLLYTYTSQKIIDTHYDKKKLENFWNHSFKVAFFAFYIAKQHLNATEHEDAYVGGLLHDIGKAIIFGVDPEIFNHINILCHTKDIPVRIIEELTNGFNHCLTGASLARKWNLPDKLIAAIEHHHNPLIANDKYKEYLFCIYLANSFCQENSLDERFYQSLDNSILYYFGISSFKLYKELLTKYDKAYTKHIENSKQKLSN